MPRQERHDAPRPEVPPASLAQPVPCTLLTLEQSGGYVSWARLFEPYAPAGPPRPVFYLHGIQSHGGWFLKSCDSLRRAGFTVLLPDRRGSGLNPLDRGHGDSPAQLVEDVDRGVRWLAARTGAARVDLVAVSWGGKLALAYAAQYPVRVRAIALIAPGLRPRVDISLVEKIAVGAHGLLQPRKLHEIPLSNPALFTANAQMLRFLERDPLKLTRATASFLLASRRLDALIHRLAPQILAPVRLFLAGQDRIIDNAATVALLQPILRPLPAWNAPAQTYPNAHHTLDFEPDPEPFFVDLAAALAHPV